ncbi:glycoside hydrolase family 9 protein [Methylobacterium sp. NEAU 140]|uniref:glycoside hydrolase family 9 protein n=1 Tax=Methylobacterium sp. NEAU 140 TaxID=3064945 RepID=UPI002733756A|nr:glycoside hydrolase family 9 protein [Methylobacterium sp. NEAU 140]MDP4023741.1 glycoside hydrolase family 9 protein [Methylobacterium sp. NEAU 140]
MHVAEVTIATPDTLAVEIRDPPFVPGGILALDAPRPEEPGTWIRHAEGWAEVIGPGRDHLRLDDIPPAASLDRKAVDTVAGYGTIGTRRVIAVYRKSTPYDSGLRRGDDGKGRTEASFRHQVYLRLDGPVPRGNHTIRWPNGVLPPTAIAYDEMSTRATALRGTQLGHTPTDTAKIAYLALWLPGGPDGGAVDFRSYGLKRFSVLDERGETVFTGDIRLRKAPDEPELGNGLPAPTTDLADAAATPRPIRMFRAASARVMSPGHGFSEGQRVVLRNLPGASNAGTVFATATDVRTDSFTAAHANAPLPAQDGAGGTAAAARVANRSGTFVLELDYSAWTPRRSGTYRLHVPGLGVSDPFAIDPDVWLTAARTAIGGLYNHRSGIALDGRFGYRRPAAFRPTEQRPIRMTRLPLSWSSEGTGGFVPFPVGAEAPWLRDGNAPPSFWGGYMDAGDWDRRINHVQIATLLLELYRSAPARLRTFDYGLPKSSEVLTEAAYSRADDIPNLLHEPIWLLDFFRRLQSSDGGVSGGIESAGHPLAGEPSFLEHQTVFAYAPDPIASYLYAGAAMKLAGVLSYVGQAELAGLFTESAERAWRFAEAGFADPDAAYADAVAVGQRTGLFAPVSWADRRAAIQQTTRDARIAAAAAFFRSGRGRSFGTVVEEAWRTGPGIDERRIEAAWDYLKAPGADPDLSAQIAAAIVQAAGSVVAAQRTATYPSIKHPYAPAGWGQGTVPSDGMIRIVMHAHTIGRDPDLLRLMERTALSLLGANQVGMSLTTGLGLRQIRHPLHEDHRAMGVSVPAGITIYGFAPQAAFSPDWLFGPSWAYLPEVGIPPHDRRRIEPDRAAFPYFEFLIEHPLVVIQQEYTVHQTISTTAALWMYIASRGEGDGDCRTRRAAERSAVPPSGARPLGPAGQPRRVSRQADCGAVDGG